MDRFHSQSCNLQLPWYTIRAVTYCILHRISTVTYYILYTIRAVTYIAYFIWSETYLARNFVRCKTFLCSVLYQVQNLFELGTLSGLKLFDCGTLWDPKLFELGKLFKLHFFFWLLFFFFEFDRRSRGVSNKVFGLNPGFRQFFLISDVDYVSIKSISDKYLFLKDIALKGLVRKIFIMLNKHKYWHFLVVRFYLLKI